MLPPASHEFMSFRITRALYVFLFTVAGAALGFLYAKHRIALSIAYMRTEWGWVCGTGLEFPLYFFTPVGGFAGVIMGIFTWRFASRYLSRPRA